MFAAIIFQKILLGISLAAPIGPVSVEMIRRGIRQGFWAAFNIRLGGAMGNTLCLIASYLGLSLLAKQEYLLCVLGLVGALILIYMGLTTLLKLRKTMRLDDPVNDEIVLSNSLFLGFVLAVFNPIALVFWLGIGAMDVQSVNDFLLNFLIIVGVLLWGGALSLFLEFGRRFINPFFFKMINLISGSILLYLGTNHAYHAAQKILLLG